MIEVQRAKGDRLCRIFVRPNRSLSPRGTLVAYAIIASASLTVVGALASRGLWVPLPFAGFELTLLAASLAWLQRQSRQLDEIEFGLKEVRVRQAGAGRGRKETFHPGWMRVELRLGRHHWYPRRLILSCSGRELEVGAFLNETEREQLAGVLGEQIGRPLKTQWQTGG